MRFLDRQHELGRLDRLVERPGGSLAVIYGRRRVGKTRLLLQWCAKHAGLYSVADQSTPDVQRRYFADAVETRLPGFSQVEYRDWASLLARLAHDAKATRWRGPIIFDELPYLVSTTPELPSILQRWVDHDASEARLVVALAGSSQRMMQGMVLSASAPLYGRAREILELGPIEPSYLKDAFHLRRMSDAVPLYAAWGGIPRYWELGAELGSTAQDQIEQLVLDPLGPLHREPDRLLIEEVPSALEVRPVLDAIGAGAHRVSEIGGRLGRPATSMARPLERLLGMQLVRREVPFGESEKQSRRSLYRIDDPFFRLWFRVVAPNRARLAAGHRASRLRVLDRFWEALVAEAWEDLCRKRLPYLPASSSLAKAGPWQPALRWWSGNSPEWDIVAESIDGKALLLGEAKWSKRTLTSAAMRRAAGELAQRTAPTLPSRFRKHHIIRALFVPEAGRARAPLSDVHVVDAAALLGAISA